MKHKRTFQLISCALLSLVFLTTSSAYARNKLTSGTIIGHTGSWGDNPATTIAAALDGDLSTYVDAPNATGNYYVGYDFGAGDEVVVAQIKFAPRAGFAARMVNGEIRGSNDPTLASYTTLATITTEPAVAVLSSLPSSSTNSFRFVYYVAPANSYCNIAELEFYPPDINLTSSTIIGHAGSYNNNPATTIAAALDGNISTYVDAPNATGNYYVGYDFGVGNAVNVGLVSFAPRGGFASRMVGGQIRGSNDPTLASWNVLATITQEPANGVMSSVSISSTNSYRFVYYYAPANSYCNIAELKFYGDIPTLSNLTMTPGTLNFQEGTFDYTVYFTDLSSPSSIDFTATADPGYTVTDGGNITLPLVDGRGVQEIEVSDGTNTTTYTVTVVALNRRHQYTFNGNANDAIGGVHGTPQGGATVSEKALVTAANGQYLSFDPAGFNFGTYDSITLEAFVVTSLGENSGKWTYLMHFGNEGGAYGYFVGLTRTDNNSVCEYSETGNLDGQVILRPEIDDGQFHHVVSVLNANEIKFYLDGELYGELPRSGPFPINAGSGTPLATLARGAWLGDSTWIGEIYEFNIYNGVMDAATVASRVHAVDDELPIIEPILADGTYRIVNRNSGMPIDIDGGSPSDGADVVQMTYDGGTSQKWVLENSSGLEYFIKSAQNTNYSFDVYDWSTADGGDIRTWTFGGGNNQKWVFAPTTTEEGYYTIKSVHSLKYLDVYGASEVDGGDVVQWSATGGYNQQWSIEPVSVVAPTGVAATSSNGVVTLTWDAQPGSTRYNIKRSYTSGSGYETIATGHSYSTYYDSMSTSGMTAYYVVSAVTSFEESADSDEVSATRLAIVEPTERPRVIVTTDGEADDQASMVRFLLTCNEFEVEAVVNNSSQFHWADGGTGWNAFHPVTWFKDYVDLYAQVYDNLLLHDPNYPSPEYLLSRWKVGNIDVVGNSVSDLTRTEGAKFIAEILLDDSDPRPIWVQAWGGCSSLASALKIIQEDYPSRMAEVAAKLRLYLIWEQDQSYKEYIYPNWESLGVQTIIADSFDCFAYEWGNDLPDSLKASHFNAPWVANNIVNGHGALCANYVNNGGGFNAEGDSPSFLHSIPRGLRSMESPDWGGWGGRFVNIRNNVWMDIQPAAAGTWTYPNPAAGEWRSIHNSWAKTLLSYAKTDRENYFKPVWRWLDDVQNDMAARADWCVMDYASANHHPVVQLNTPLDLTAAPGDVVTLDATPTTDPDGDTLSYNWWHYYEADSYAGSEIAVANTPFTTITIPAGASLGDEIHVICEVTDNGSPALTQYQRVVITVDAETNIPPAAPTSLTATPGDGVVDLSWTTNSEPDLASYTVYRSTESGTNYVAVASNLTVSTYSDNAVTNGTTYYYVVTATDDDANESAFSSEVSALPSGGAIDPEEYHIDGHAVIGGTNMSLSVSDSSVGLLYQMLSTESLMPPDWQPEGGAVGGNGSNMVFNMPITTTNRYFKLDVQRQ